MGEMVTFRVLYNVFECPFMHFRDGTDRKLTSKRLTHPERLSLIEVGNAGRYYSNGGRPWLRIWGSIYKCICINNCGDRK